ncbi:MAG: hypothetical protein LBG88_02450 [Christensenellaceae bacterium]|jgi:hypothetical protein|nr:hypothetical protein [Christensenellaceae bacterium]
MMSCFALILTPFTIKALNLPPLYSGPSTSKADSLDGGGTYMPSLATPPTEAERIYATAVGGQTWYIELTFKLEQTMITSKNQAVFPLGQNLFFIPNGKECMQIYLVNSGVSYILIL